MRVEATIAVVRRLKKVTDPRIRAAFDAAVERLAQGRIEGPSDKPTRWPTVWRDITNHRHLDLPDGWRLCFTTVQVANGELLVRILFLGTHREYEQRYGF